MSTHRTTTADPHDVAPPDAGDPPVWGLMAEFENVDTLVDAAERVRDAGYSLWDCHSPFPVHAVEPAMGLRRTILPFIVLGGGITGASLGILMQWWMNAINYPLNISGKPLWSIPANIPVIFELTVLLSALCAVFGMLGLNKLPELSHSVFSSPRFRRATIDRFFITIEATDPVFDMKRTQALLESLGVVGAVEVLLEEED